MSQTKEKLHAFLSGLDTNDRQRLKDIGLAAFEDHANSFPGPDEWVKGKVRPHVGAFIESLINDLLQ